MIIAIPKPRKQGEARLTATPETLGKLIAAGHTILVEQGAGEDLEMSDTEFRKLGKGVSILPKEYIYKTAELICTVKEPLEEEQELLASAPPGVHMFCYLHQPKPWHLELFKKLSAVVIPFERVITKNGLRPLLAPMSRIAAEVCVLRALNHIASVTGRRKRAKDAILVVIGSEGIGGQTAIEYALGCGFVRENIAGLDLEEKLTKSDYAYEYKTYPATARNIKELLKIADAVISTVKQGDKKAPKIITEEMIAGMPHGSFFADMAIDEGGSSETSMPTTHENPTYENKKHGVTHYCVANMPAAMAKSATRDLAEATLPYLLAIGNSYPLTEKTNWDVSELIQELKNAVTFY